ncbi:MAG: GIY-YIG nuclease family protein [Desulfobulbaceae bacterium]|nr:GIY-YIG nuclease family protein [Desulfobulbaceae bacterium]
MTTKTPWYVYMVRCCDGTLYTGISTDLDRRIAEHNSEKGGAKYTRPRRPVHLVYSEQIDSRSAATKREYCLRKLSASEKRELIADAC